MNMASQSCCRRSGDDHAQYCIDRKEKWVVRRDGFSINDREPWTVYHYARSLGSYTAWASAMTFDEALGKVQGYIRAYATS